MPITRQFSNINLSFEQRHVIELAFNSTLRRLNLVDRSDPLCDLVDKTMIKVYERGVTNAVALAEITIREIGQLR
ncbi:hypothetical protein [Bradyrhizobium sp. USDA 4454]